MSTEDTKEDPLLVAGEEEQKEEPPAAAPVAAVGDDAAAKPAAAASSTEVATEEAPKPQEPVVEEGAIWEPADNDVLSGRGASVNAHNGNKKFRAICFARKPEFEAGNHAAKRRIATEIVTHTVNTYSSRFLKRKQDKGPWYEMTHEQAILKACQVMRDHKRPDRIAQRQLMASTGRKRNRATATPMDEVHIPPPPKEPIIENPFGVHDHDVLSGRGAFVNGHVGNARLRKLAMERKAQFDAGNYTEKRALATEIVTHIRSLDPPGRFLKRADSKQPGESTEGLITAEGEGLWEELLDEKAIHKACQVMRDIARPDRKERDERRRLKKLRKEGKLPPEEPPKEAEPPAELQPPVGTSQVVEEAVAAAAEAMDKAFEPNQVEQDKIANATTNANVEEKTEQQEQVTVV